MSTPVDVLRIEGLSKTFPGQRALDDVSIDVRAGEVHALIGENGSGKSTLIKCLAGVYTPDPGARITIGGTEMGDSYSPSEAIKAGCGFVHQDLGLVPTLSVAENIALSHGYRTSLGRILWRSNAERAAKLLRVFTDDIDPNALISSLSAAKQTLVGIARGLRDASEGAKLLVLDEPTASLPEGEVRALFAAVRRVTKAGIGIVYVSHRLNEIFEIADRVTVIRDGRVVGTWAIDEIDERTLIEKIVGRSLEKFYPPATRTTDHEALLRVEHLSGSRVQDASFTVGRGEVVGVAGLLASGRSELARLIFGAQTATAGEIELDGISLRGHEPREAMQAGIAFIPQERRRAGSHGSMTVRENITLSSIDDFVTGGRIRSRKEAKAVTVTMDTFDVRPRDPERRFETLSGGNQQKAVFAKWMRRHPKLLILDEPVQGVDVGSAMQIYEQIEEIAAQGAGILMIDSELEDLCRLCDRILVLRNGRIVDELKGDARTKERILELIYIGKEAA
ncbi:sugar ABC transporter ATP-binding protein [Salinibacterium sp. ZJ454]|uniref:sugar ABC transporter ATP-binding protein n=1 Tax=Salinibacterium sp. ZJ454 TaxID=2708339 RepID=UPI001423F674|nr:sugar ABC transporter ATP-binding protein [Salinibacterium sp. ZJ454]